MTQFYNQLINCSKDLK